MSWYLLLKFIHVLLAITALGSNITYGVWNMLAAREPANLPFALRGISLLDRVDANPLYGLLLLTGLGLVAIIWGWRLWFGSRLILFVLLFLVVVGLLPRALRQ